ncbi:hypothetical protein [Pararhodonellum marinum]|uniref:hypothetical protein n=1 Tax=Pararhodonellum marinum TaxID=2755358 RepID=UPI0018908054|nr:hypothetical protein [Pararhodonellum marinum]
MTQVETIKKQYKILERNVLILIAIPLSLFGFAYLYTNSGNLDWDLPEIPKAFSSFLLGLTTAILVLQYVNFHNTMKKIRFSLNDLEQKIQSYSKATISRFWQLFFVGLICTAGLLVFDNAGFTIAYAVTLLFISIGKPTPQRIIRLLRLKEREKETILEINR